MTSRQYIGRVVRYRHGDFVFVGMLTTTENDCNILIDKDGGTHLIISSIAFEVTRRVSWLDKIGYHRGLRAEIRKRFSNYKIHYLK